MSSGGGRRNKETTMPKFMETAIQQGIGMGTDAAQVGYVPYYGPDVAAFSPMQNAAFAGTDAMAQAFGMPTAGNQSYFPEATQMGGGMGYSSGDIYDAAVAELQAKRPAQAEYIDSFVIDPVTGQAGVNAPTRQPVAIEMSGGKGGK